MKIPSLRPVRSYMRHGRAQRRMLREAALVVTAVRVALSVLPYGLLRRLRRPITRLVGTFGAPACPEHDLVAAVRTAARHVRGATCLTQAIALYLLLARRSIASHLVVGVTRHGGRFEAHAWVDRDGRVLIGGDVTRFSKLLRVGAITR